ncbi:Tigger transposable element-derived protein 2 [Anthophora plagiata]
MSTRKVNLSMHQRLQDFEDLKTLPVSTVAAKHHVHSITVRRIKRNVVRIQEFESKTEGLLQRQRVRKPVYEELERRLYTWFTERRTLGDFLKDAVLLEKAEELKQGMASCSNFKVSKSWLAKFKRRHNICLVKAYGEKTSADEDAARNFVQKFQHFIEDNDINIENVYNMDESGLFSKAFLTKTLASEKNVSGCKIRKDRITIGLCSNITGNNKMMPLVIYKYRNPRGLKHLLHRLPVIFKSQRNAWIDRELFINWYQNYFKPSVRTYQLRKGLCGKVVLSLDNCTSHQVPEDIQDQDNFQIMYLPPNTTSFIQPMDQGIIEKTKRLFKKQMLRTILTHEGGINEFYKHYTIKDCIDMVVQVWAEITPENITNGWNNLIETPSHGEDDLEEKHLAELISTVSEGKISEAEATLIFCPPV